MKYYIANGNAYISFTKTDDSHVTATITSKLIEASLYKTYEDAKRNLTISDLDKSVWCVQKYWRATKPGKKFFVVTNCTNYISTLQDKPLVTKYGGNKWFRTLQSAADYIRNNKPFDESYVFDESCNLVDMSAYSERKFTPAQKVQLGIDQQEEKTHKRIVIGKNIKGLVYAKDKGVCQLCGRKIPANDNTWNIDHIVPLARGGDNSLDNYQLTCISCNRLKDSMRYNEAITGMSNIIAYKFLNKADDSDRLLQSSLIRSIVQSRIQNAIGDSDRGLEIRKRLNALYNVGIGEK